MPMIYTAHSLTVSLFGDNGGAKKGRQANAFSLKDIRLSYLFKKPFSLLVLRLSSVR